jgi:hypothetical protein
LSQNPLSTAEHVEALTPAPLMQIATGFWAFKLLGVHGHSRARTTAWTRVRSSLQAHSGLVARMVEPMAPNLAALRRVSSNVECA